LFLARPVNGECNSPLHSHILNGQQYSFLPFAFLMDLPGIEQHLSMPDGREIMFDLIIMKFGFFPEDIFQKLPEFRNVPLTAAEVVDDLALCIFFVDLKSRKKPCLQK